MVTYIVVQLIVPEWRIFGQAIYTVTLMSLIGFALSQLDKRPAPTENLKKKKASKKQ